jgi:hypothetical protein
MRLCRKLPNSRSHRAAQPIRPARPQVRDRPTNARDQDAERPAPSYRQALRIATTAPNYPHTPPICEITGPRSKRSKSALNALKKPVPTTTSRNPTPNRERDQRTPSARHKHPTEPNHQNHQTEPPNQATRTRAPDRLFHHDEMRLCRKLPNSRSQERQAERSTTAAARTGHRAPGQSQRHPIPAPEPAPPGRTVTGTGASTTRPDSDRNPAISLHL